MAKNKAQKAAEAREAEAARTREGSDNPAAIQEKMDAVAAQPKPNGKAEVAQAKANTATPTTQPATISKQNATVETLKAGWTAKGVDLSKLTIKDDGKFKVLVVAEGWPRVTIGPTGGVVVTDLKSYAKAFDAAMDGLALYQKQNDREAKRAAASQPAVPAVKAVA
jgi:hypothetical protein